MASRFVVTKECQVHENIKNELIKRQEFDTTLFGRSMGLQGRGLLNQALREVIAIEERGGGLQELIPLMAGDRIKKAWETGDIEYAPLMVGQSIGLINDIPTCEELLDRMGREAGEILARTSRMIN